MPETARLVQQRRHNLTAAAVPLVALMLIAIGGLSIHWGMAAFAPGILLWFAVTRRQPPAPTSKGDD